jgi:hypothetical protein
MPSCLAGKNDLVAINAADKDAKDSKKAMLDLAGGVNERLNWVYLNTFINEALPRPDGTHVVKQAHNGSRPYEKYFDAKAQGLYLRWLQMKAKVTEGAALNADEQREMEDVKKYLIQINIEGVAAMFTNTLPKDIGIRLSKGSQPPPAGWVIEIRAYTYHYDGQDFVFNTLCENLTDLADDPKYRRLEGVKLSPDVEAVVRGKDASGADKQLVTCVSLYNPQIIENYQPGKFYTIKDSPFATFLKVAGPPTLALGAKKDAAPGPAAAAAAKSKYELPTRASWRPPMLTVIGESFGLPLSGIGGQAVPLGFTPLPPLGAANQAGVIVRAPRLEFTVVFVWTDPALPL